MTWRRYLFWGSFHIGAEFIVKCLHVEMECQRYDAMQILSLLLAIRLQTMEQILLVCQFAMV